MNEITKTKAGRPSQYKPEYIQSVYKLALLGLRDSDIAQYYEVSEVTLNAWKNENPLFLKSLNAGKIEADYSIAESLYQKGRGILTTKETRQIIDENGIKQDLVTTKEHLPDTTSAIFWLKNRQRAYWSDRTEINSNIVQTNLHVLTTKIESKEAWLKELQQSRTIEMIDITAELLSDNISIEPLTEDNND